MRLSICHSNLVRVINIPISGGVGRGNRATQLEQNESVVSGRVRVNYYFILRWGVAGKGRLAKVVLSAEAPSRGTECPALSPDGDCPFGSFHL